MSGDGTRTWVRDWPRVIIYVISVELDDWLNGTGMSSIGGGGAEKTSKNMLTRNTRNFPFFGFFVGVFLFYGYVMFVNEMCRIERLITWARNESIWWGYKGEKADKHLDMGVTRPGFDPRPRVIIYVISVELDDWLIGTGFSSIGGGGTEKRTKGLTDSKRNTRIFPFFPFFVGVFLWMPYSMFVS